MSSMMHGSLTKLKITGAKKQGPYLQIFGHQNSQLLTQLNEHLSTYQSGYQQNAKSVDQLQLNGIYLTVHGQQCYRCRYIGPKATGNVSVECIDYGIDIEVPVHSVSI